MDTILSKTNSQFASTYGNIESDDNSKLILLVNLFRSLHMIKIVVSYGKYTTILTLFEDHV